MNDPTTSTQNRTLIALCICQIVLLVINVILLTGSRANNAQIERIESDIKAVKEKLNASESEKKLPDQKP